MPRPAMPDGFLLRCRFREFADQAVEGRNMAVTQQAVEGSFRGRVKLNLPLGDFKNPAVGKIPSGRVVVVPML